MIKNFENFINEEVSKNDPIPELNRYNKKLGIILLGTPGGGKSTFIKNYIIPRNQSFKTFSTDDVSLMFTKDPNQYHVGSSELNVNRILNFLKTGQNFIYDTTGGTDKNISKIFEESRKFEYKLIFIQLYVDLDTAISQNFQRDRNVDLEYLNYVHSVQYDKMYKFDKELKPDNYYIIWRKENTFKFYKYQNGKMFKRKVDQYVPVSSI